MPPMTPPMMDMVRDFMPFSVSAGSAPGVGDEVADAGTECDDVLVDVPVEEVAVLVAVVSPVVVVVVLVPASLGFLDWSSSRMHCGLPSWPVAETFLSAHVYPNGQQPLSHDWSLTSKTDVSTMALSFLSGSCSATSQGMGWILSHLLPSGQQTAVVDPASDWHCEPCGQQKLEGSEELHETRDLRGQTLLLSAEERKSEGKAWTTALLLAARRASRARRLCIFVVKLCVWMGGEGRWVVIIRA